MEDGVESNGGRPGEAGRGDIDNGGGSNLHKKRLQHNPSVYKL